VVNSRIGRAPLSKCSQMLIGVKESRKQQTCFSRRSQLCSSKPFMLFSVNLKGTKPILFPEFFRQEKEVGFPEFVFMKLCTTTHE